MKGWALVVALFFGSHGLPAQEAYFAFQGAWTATAGPSQVFRGAWTAQFLPDRPNLAEGSWTLVSDTGQILLEGTWSAQKARVGWQGTWAARTRRGGSLSGTWKSDITDLDAKTFTQMLERTAEKEIAGSWRSGRYQGNWWLKGSRARASLRRTG